MESRERKDTALRQLLRSGRAMKLALERSFRSPRAVLCSSPLRPVYRPATVLPHPVTVHLSRRSSADSRESTYSGLCGSFLTQPRKPKSLRPITHERSKSHMSSTTARSKEAWGLKTRFDLSLLPDFRVTIVHVEDVFSGKRRERTAAKVRFAGSAQGFEGK